MATPQWTPPELDVPGDEGADWTSGLTADEERVAATEFAMQQLTERPFGSVRPVDTLPASGAQVSPEEMRNRALAQALDRQQRMARENPRPAPPPNWEGPATGQRTSGVTISPRLTVAPTLTGRRPDLPVALAPAGLSGPLREIVDGSGPVGLEPHSQSGPPQGSGPEVWTRPAKPRRGPSPAPAAPMEEAAATPGAPRPGTRSPEAVRAPAPTAPAVRTRSVQRRGLGRPASSSSSESETRWRALAELADLLAIDVYPGDALPRLSRWLAETADSTVAVLLLTDDTIDEVTAWPTDDPVAGDLEGSIGAPIDDRSSVWEAVRDGHLLAGYADEAMTMPSGALASGVGAWVVVPLIDHEMAFGALVVVRSEPEPISSRLLSLLEDVAQRVARALYNCEEAAGNAPTGDGGIPEAVRSQLGAVAIVLGAMQGGPGPALAPEQNQAYRQITQQAAVLAAQVERFLNGHGSASP